MKIGIVGMGSVGSSVAISLLHAGLARTLLVQDLRADRAEGEAMDLAHGAPFFPAADVRAVAIGEMLACDVVIVAAGKAGSPTQTRLELLRDNARMAREVGALLAGSKGVIVVVSNPVDVLVRVMVEASGLPAARVIGTGTMLDTARLRRMLASKLAIDPRSLHAQVIGEHGDSEVVLWSSASVGGIGLRSLHRWKREDEDVIALDVRTAAYEVIKRKGMTNHAIGLVTAALVRSLLRDERRVLTVSRVQEGKAGIREVALSLPTIVGRDGATEVLEPPMDDGERAALERSAGVLAASFTGAVRGAST